jgi:O-antigen/teichoic acid export membrane protein
MRLRQAMLSSTLQQNATLLLSFATGVVIAHLLTPRETGSYSVAIATVNAVAGLKEAAIGSYVVSAPELDSALLRAAFGLTLTITAGLTLAFLGLSFPLAAFYQDPALGQALRVVAFAQLGPALAFSATMLLMRAMRFGSLLAVGITATISQSLVSIALAALGYGAAALAWGYFASAIVTASMTIAFRPDAVRLRPVLRGSRRLLAFGSWTSATLLVGSTAMSAPELMIGRALGLADAALFARAQNLVSSVRNGLFVGLTRPLLPSLGEREGKGTSLVPIYQRIVETITGLTWPVYAVLAIWAEPLVRTIYGDAWSAAGTMMPTIAIAHALTLAVAPHYDILIVKRRQRLLFVTEVAVFAFTVVALAIGLTLGLDAAVWSLVLSSAFFAVCYFIVIKSVIEFAPSALYKAWSRSLALTLVAVPVPLAFRHFVTDGPVEIILGFVVSSMISAVIWITVVFLIGHELSLHFSGLLRSVSLPSRLAGFSGLWPQPHETDRG